MRDGFTNGVTYEEIIDMSVRKQKYSVYVMNLSNAELRENLIQRMINVFVNSAKGNRKAD